jgi:membrane protein
MTVFGRELVPLVKRVGKETLDDNVLGLAAETAWSFFFGLFPTVLFALPLLSLFGDRREWVQTIMNQLSVSLPADTVGLISKVITEIVDTDSAPGLISVGLLLALWSGSSMFASLMAALNRAYEIQETRPWWRQRLIAAACTILGIGVVWISAIIMVGGEQIGQIAVRLLRLDPAEAVVLAVVQYVLAFILLATFIWVLYLVLPAGTQNKRTSMIGAMVATVLWMVFTLLFRLYVQNFETYNKAYGAIGAVMVLLTWMYWTMFVILVGGELNAEFEDREEGSQARLPEGNR